MSARGRKVLIRVAVSAAVIALLLQFVSWTSIRQALLAVPLTTFALVVLGFLASHLVGTLKWRLVLRVAGARLRVVDAIECYSAGIFSNIFLPSIVGGDVLRALLAGRRSGRMEAAVLGGAADRLLDITALGLLALCGGLFVGFRNPGAARTLLVLAVALAVIFALALIPLLIRRPLHRWPKKFRRRIALVLIALRRQRRRPGLVLLAFLGACLIQGSLTLLNIPLGRALGIEAPLSAWFFAWSLSKVASLLPVSFNGIGVRDAAFAALIVPLMTNPGLSDAAKWGLAVASSLSWQATLLVSSLIAGAVWGWLKRFPRQDRAPPDLLSDPRTKRPVAEHA